MIETGAPCTVYAPGGVVWHHPRVVWWAVWLRVSGWRGRLPRWAVRWCGAAYPEATCRCGSYAIAWGKEDDGGKDEEQE